MFYFVIFYFVVFYYHPLEDCFLMRDRKGMTLDGRGGVDLGDVEEWETVIMI